jgi:hypothetical protein
MPSAISSSAAITTARGRPNDVAWKVAFNTSARAFRAMAFDHRALSQTALVLPFVCLVSRVSSQHLALSTRVFNGALVDALSILSLLFMQLARDAFLFSSA